MFRTYLLVAIHELHFLFHRDPSSCRVTLTKTKQERLRFKPSIIFNWQCLTMRSPPILHLDDADAETAAAHGREQGAAVISSHLSNHLEHNPGRSSDFVTWIATLHPENADVSVDERFFIPGNPWWRIYEEQCKLQGIPSATAVPVNSDPTDPEAVGQPTVNGAPKPPPPPHYCLQCSPVDMFTGLFISLMAFFGVFLTETLALLIYLVAAFFYKFANALCPPNAFTGLPYSFLMVFYYSFALADSFTLLSSVLVAEFVALAAWISTFCFGGLLRANEWHQFVRRNCHFIRAAYRKHFQEPPRHFCVVGMREGRVSAEATAQAVPVPEVNHAASHNEKVPGYEREVIVVDGSP